MSEPRKHGATGGAFWRRFSSVGVDLFRRAYALAIIFVICGLSWRAISYLVDGLLRPSDVPPQISGLPLRLDAQALTDGADGWTGLQVVENARSPLSRYHRFHGWVQPDARNDCVRSGCHGPLPHAERKEVRAFLNMHASAMHCGVCHLETESEQPALGWYDIQTGVRSEPPALLRAAGWLDAAASQPVREFSSDDQAAIVGLLRAAHTHAAGSDGLEALADHLAAVRPASPAFAQLVDEGRATVARAFRGSYGAKLALLGADGRPILAHPGAEAAVRDFLARGAAAAQEQREAMLSAVHPRRRAEPLDCSACHVASGSRMEFAALGYPPARVERLLHSAIFQMIQHIADGQPFHMPNVLPAEAPRQP